MAGAPSGTYSFNPSYSELVLDAFERCGMRSNAFTQEHILSARRSINLVLSTWTNRGINLWKVDIVSVLMTQGERIYPVDTSVVDVLDTYLRQYQMGNPVNVTPGFSTTIGSDIVTVNQTNNGNAAGNYVSIVVPVSVGGFILQGFYQVYSVPGVNQWTIKLPTVATATVVDGGNVPSFTTTAGSTGVSVNLPNHGYVPGSQFQVQVLTQIGGLNIQGPYYIQSVTDTNNFVITSPFPAGFSQNVTENAGQTQISSQATIEGYTQNADPVDILLFPLSRNDYAAIPDKAQQGRPTSYWFDRTPPAQNLYIWLTPDGNGPYELRYYVWRQIQDANVQGGDTPDMPYRFLEALTSAVAAHLAMKWAPDRAQSLAAYAAQCWKEASDEDREKVSWFPVPDMSGYFN